MEDFLISLYENTENGLKKLEDFFIYMDKEIEQLKLDIDFLTTKIHENEKLIREGINEYYYLEDLIEDNSKKIKNIQKTYVTINSIVDEQLEAIEYRLEKLDEKIISIKSIKENIKTKGKDVLDVLDNIEDKIILFKEQMELLNITKEETKTRFDELLSFIDNQTSNTDYLQQELKEEAITTASDFPTIVDEWLETLLSIKIDFINPSYYPEETSIAYIKDTTTKAIKYETNKECDVDVYNSNGVSVYKDSVFSNSKIINPKLTIGHNDLEIKQVSKKGYHEKITPISIYAFDQFLKYLFFDQEDIEVVNTTKVLNYEADSIGTFHFNDSLLQILRNNIDLIDDFSIDLYFDDVLIDSLNNNTLPLTTYHNTLSGPLIEQTKFSTFFENITTETKKVNIKSVLNIPSENIIAEDIIVKRVLMPMLDATFEWFYNLHNESSEHVDSNLDLKVTIPQSVNSYELYFVKPGGTEERITRNYDVDTLTNNILFIDDIISNLLSSTENFERLDKFYDFYRNDDIDVFIRLYRETYYSGEYKDVPSEYFIAKPPFESEAYSLNNSSDYKPYFNHIDYNNPNSMLEIETNIRNLIKSDCKITLPFTNENLYDKFSGSTIIKTSQLNARQIIECSFDPKRIDIRNLAYDEDYYKVPSVETTSLVSETYLKGDVFDYSRNTPITFKDTPIYKVATYNLIEETANLTKVNSDVAGSLDFMTTWDTVFHDDEESRLFINVGLLVQGSNYENENNYKTLYDNYSGHEFAGNDTIDQIAQGDYTYSIPVTQAMLDEVIAGGQPMFIIKIETGYYIRSWDDRETVKKDYYYLPNVDIQTQYIETTEPVVTIGYLDNSTEDYDTFALYHNGVYLDDYVCYNPEAFITDIELVDGINELKFVGIRSNSGPLTAEIRVYEGYGQNEIPNTDTIDGEYSIRMDAPSVGDYYSPTDYDNNEKSETWIVYKYASL